MQITIKLFAGFRDGRFAVREMEVGPETTVGRIVEKLEIPPAEVGVLLCNGRHVDFGHRLRDGDTCSIFPKVGGG